MKRRKFLLAPQAIIAINTLISLTYLAVVKIFEIQGSLFIALSAIAITIAIVVDGVGILSQVVALKKANDKCDKHIDD